MPVTKDVSFKGNTVGNNPVLTISVTVAANADRYMICFVGGVIVGGVPVIASITYNGVAMSLLGSVGGGLQAIQWVYGLLAPSTGTHDVVITGTGTTMALNATGYVAYDVDPDISTTTVRTAGGTAALSTNVDCLEDGVALACSQAWFNLGVVSPTPRNGHPYFNDAGSLHHSSSGTSLALNTQPARQIGDWEFAVVAVENNSTHSSASAGWVKVDELQQSTTITASYWKRFYDGTDQTLTVTWTGSAQNFGVRFGVRDVQLADPAVSNIGTFGSGTASPHTSTGANTAANLTLAMAIDLVFNVITDFTTPAGWTSAFTLTNSADNRIKTVTKQVPTSGSATGNISSAGGAGPWIDRQLAWLPHEAGAQVVEETNEQLNFNGSQDHGMYMASEDGYRYNSFGWSQNTTPARVNQLALGLLPVNATIGRRRNAVMPSA